MTLTDDQIDTMILERFPLWTRLDNPARDRAMFRAGLAAIPREPMQKMVTDLTAYMQDQRGAGWSVERMCQIVLDAAQGGKQE